MGEVGDAASLRDVTLREIRALTPASCNEKVRRARLHARELIDATEGWIDSDHFLIEQRRLSPTRIGVGLVVPSPAPVIEWAVLLGEIAHDLRSALDQIAHALSRIATGEQEPWTYFPIAAQPKERTDPVKHVRERVKGVAGDALDLLVALQPTDSDAMGSTRDALRLLNDVNRIDKHHAPLLFQEVLPLDGTPLAAMGPIPEGKEPFEDIQLFTGAAGVVDQAYLGHVDVGSPLVFLQIVPHRTQVLFEDPEHTRAAPDGSHAGRDTEVAVTWLIDRAEQVINRLLPAVQGETVVDPGDLGSDPSAEFATGQASITHKP